MNGVELKQFRTMVGLSQNDIATVFGYSLRQIQLMEKGKQLVRPGMGLACAAYALGIREYDGPAVREQWKRRMAHNG